MSIRGGGFFLACAISSVTAPPVLVPNCLTVTVMCCKGRIAYGAEAAALSGEFAELAPQTRRVVIDLSGVELIDAAGLGALISVALTAQTSQCAVTLAAPGNFIRELLELTKLTSVFEVHPTLDAATVASRRQAA